MWRKLLCMGLLALAGNAWGGSKDVVVSNVWVTESAPGQKTASVQAVVTCVAASGKLLAIDSPAAESAEVQRPWPSGGKIQMSKVRNVRLRRGQAMEFGSRTASYYLMLLGLKQPLKAGDHIPVNLTVLLADGQKISVEAKAEVRPSDLSYKQYNKSGAPAH